MESIFEFGLVEFGFGVLFSGFGLSRSVEGVGSFGVDGSSFVFLILGWRGCIVWDRRIGV